MNMNRLFWTLMHFLTPVPIFIVLLSYVTMYICAWSEIVLGLLAGDFVLQFLYLVCAHFLSCLAISTYFRAVFSNPPPVPSSYRIPHHFLKQLKWTTIESYNDQQKLVENFAIDRGLTINNRSYGAIRVCMICKIVKPDRCHHCRKCNKCMMGFDHHCPWIANCVHAGNRKLFLLACLYTQLLCLFGSITSYPLWGPFVHGLFGDEYVHMPNTSVMLIVALQFAFGVGTTILFVFNIFLVGMNWTTIEMGGYIGRRTKKNIYDLSLRLNFQEVFGRNKWLWFAPVVKQGDPLYFIAKVKKPNKKDCGSPSPV